jgi:hypothetical protein
MNIIFYDLLVTGLDPAEPHFSQTDAVVRLDTSDAKFVDIVRFKYFTLF